MDIIHLLPDSVANQIAAGEVIQRPASCLKELVENSLDAGAQHIRVLVKDAGRTLLQVVDDGSGMSETDARMAFERHATSKIQSAADLFSLRTMGFRGEALASICAVAQVEMLTRRAESEVGTLLEIHGSQVVRQEICQCPVGTNLKVKNLFFNVPVRRKFLKTDQTELRNLLTEFYHIVLVYPKIQFTFVSNDEVLLDLPAGTEKQRIEQLFGKPSKPITASMVDVRTDTELVSIRGFVGKPEAAGRNAQQYFFVNGRYMRHPYFHKAVMTAYSGMLPGETNPNYFLYFDIAPESIDVNIHPTKTEIKFQDEQAVFQILMAAVREALGKFSLGPSLDFSKPSDLEMPIPNADIPVDRPRVVVDPTYNPFRASGTQRSVSSPRQWETLYPSRTERSVEPEVSELPGRVKTDSPERVDYPDFPDLTYVQEPSLFGMDVEAVDPWQYAGKYILLPGPGGLLVVNQHRAHVCVLTHQYLGEMQNQRGASQQLLFPEVLTLQPEQMIEMASVVDDLRYVGFDLEQLSPNSYAVNGIPSQLGTASALQVLQHILSEVHTTGTTVAETWQRRIALSLARDTAIPYGKTLTREEMLDLLKRLFALPTYRMTEDGQRVVVQMGDDEIAKRF